MTLSIFVDTNIVIYAVGRDHVFKKPSQKILTLASLHAAAFFTDSEMLQELLHRYLRLHVWQEGRQILRHFADLMRGRIEPVGAQDVEEAASLADRHGGGGDRNLVHAAVMRRMGADEIVSADRDFDLLPMLRLLDPTDLSIWRSRIGEPAP